jgi:hypothetical protein
VRICAWVSDSFIVIVGSLVLNPINRVLGPRALPITGQGDA